MHQYTQMKRNLYIVTWINYKLSRLALTEVANVKANYRLQLWLAASEYVSWAAKWLQMPSKTNSKQHAVNKTCGHETNTDSRQRLHGHWSVAVSKLLVLKSALDADVRQASQTSKLLIK